MVPTLKIAAVFLLVFANGFFVASEFALVGVRRSRIATLAATGDARAKTLLGLVDNLNAYISATQLGITLASLALGWIGEPAVAHLLEIPLKGRISETLLHTISFTIAFSIITFLHIVLGELAPKTIALERAEKTALAIAWPMQLFYKVFYYPIRLLDWAGTRTVRLLGLHPTSDHASVYTEDELRHLIEVSRRSGHLEVEEHLVNSIFEFSDAEVREAMIPRTEVQGIEEGATLDEVKRVFRSSGYSRLPVYRERLDEVVGIISRRDLEPYLENPPADGFDLKQLVRPAQFIPAGARLGAALTRMQAARAHLAIVVDEHGGMEGILTLEDLLEEIVGEISDEYDEEVRSQIAKETDGSYVLSGMLTVRDANRRLKLDLPEDPGYTTLAGFLLAQAGRLLAPKETVGYQNLVFTVERVERRRIRRVRLTFTPPKPEVTPLAMLPFLGALACDPLAASLF